VQLSFTVCSGCWESVVYKGHDIWRAFGVWFRGPGLRTGWFSLYIQFLSSFTLRNRVDIAPSTLFFFRARPVEASQGSTSIHALSRTLVVKNASGHVLSESGVHDSRGLVGLRVYEGLVFSRRWDLVYVRAFVAGLLAWLCYFGFGYPLCTKVLQRCRFLRRLIVSSQGFLLVTITRALLTPFINEVDHVQKTGTCRDCPFRLAQQHFRGPIYRTRIMLAARMSLFGRINGPHSKGRQM
jgi:hypothetical protein